MGSCETCMLWGRQCCQPAATAAGRFTSLTVGCRWEGWADPSSPPSSPGNGLASGSSPLVSAAVSLDWGRQQPHSAGTAASTRQVAVTHKTPGSNVLLEWSNLIDKIFTVAPQNQPIDWQV